MMNLQPMDIQEIPDIDVDRVVDNLFVSMTQATKGLCCLRKTSTYLP
jgi:hypothetical protein